MSATSSTSGWTRRFGGEVCSNSSLFKVCQLEGCPISNQLLVLNRSSSQTLASLIIQQTRTEFHQTFMAKACDGFACISLIIFFCSQSGRKLRKKNVQGKWKIRYSSRLSDQFWRRNRMGLEPRAFATNRLCVTCFLWVRLKAYSDKRLTTWAMWILLGGGQKMSRLYSNGGALPIKMIASLRSPLIAENCINQWLASTTWETPQPG